MSAIGDGIKARREQLGLKQTELAERLGVSPAHVCNVEHGSQADMKVSTLARWAEALECTPAELLTGGGD